MSYEMIIGLEVHVELRTRTKMFCACENRYGAPPNTCVCPVCMGLPGALPTVNHQAMRLAARAGLALGCQVHPVSRFDRKNYFYPDLPKAYQITQFDHPLCEGGGVTIRTPAGEKIIGITRIHVEEDAGKLIHSESGTAIDLNRCGVPLIEIVSEPDIRSPEEAVAYLRKLRSILVYAGISDCRMNEGSLRCDVNLSLHRPGEPFGTRTEMKNLNSFQSVERAILAEAARQAQVLDAGGLIVQETRRYDQKTGQTFSMRQKENSADYRYFPEPDIPPIALTEAEIAAQAAAIPALPDQRQAAYRQRYGLPADAAELLTADRWLADYFEEAAALAASPLALANLLLGEASAQMTLRDTRRDGERIRADLPIAPSHMAELADLSASGRLNSSTAKKVLAALFDQDQSPGDYAAQNGLFQITDETQLRAAVQQALHQNPALVASYKAGKTTVQRALMGKAMALTQGRADPEKLQIYLTEALSQ